MKNSISKILFLVLLFSFILILPFLAFSDEEREERQQQGSSGGATKYMTPATDPIYLQECGSCHLAFQAELLPSTSWERLMKGLNDHFGEDATLAAEHLHPVTAYLMQNAADQSQSKVSKKFLKSLNGDSPLRISEIPYFKREHREVRAGVIERKQIGSWANCAACHTSAERGIYDEKYIKIPR